jgi:S-methylmethionine-dependent homocysteine/selenocysteine methylase
MMSTPSLAHVPDAFQQLCNDFQSYPANHVQTRTLSAAKDATKRRLDNDEIRLFSKESIEIAVRDFTGSTPEATEQAQRADILQVSR